MEPDGGKKMTPEERQQEWEVEYQTRLGMMAGTGRPTHDQAETARQIADDHCLAVDLQDGLDETNSP